MKQNKRRPIGARRDAAQPASERRRDRLGKQQQLRGELIAAGLALFRKKGFDGTTASEIAAAAGTSRRTFFRYFASKDDVVFDWVDEQGKFVRTLLATMPAGTEPVAALHEALLRLARFMDNERDKSMALTQIVFDTPLLDRRYHAENSRWENEVLDFLLSRHGKADAFALRVQISAASSAFVAAMRAWAADDHAKPLLHWVKAAFRVLASGLGKLGKDAESRR